MSDGVTGSDGGGGRLNSVGLDMVAVEMVLRHEDVRYAAPSELFCTNESVAVRGGD
jgi:hypothetical protein